MTRPPELNGRNVDDLSYRNDVAEYVRNWCDIDYGTNTDYSKALEATLEKVEQAGGKICKPIFSFPGGRRFHFTDPSNNEFAVWSE